MYAFSTQLSLPYDDAIDGVKNALKDQGFGILSDIDVQATLKEKLGANLQPYRILGACNPPLAQQAITAEPTIGLLLPCNVVVRALDQGKVSVDFMDPQAVLGLVDNPDIEALADDVRKRLEKVRDTLS